MKIRVFPLSAVLLGACLASLYAQKMATPTGEAPGPWILGTVGVGLKPDKSITTTALKGLAIKVGEKGEAAVAYDLDLCRMAGAWTGKFTTPMNLMSRGEYPTAMGEVAFTTGEVAGFISEGSAPARPTSEPESGTRGSASLRWTDPRQEPFGPLPPGQARFKGFYVNGDKTILKWEIGGVEILEMATYERRGEWPYFTRWFHISEAGPAIEICVGKIGPNDKLSATAESHGDGWNSAEASLSSGENYFEFGWSGPSDLVKAGATQPGRSPFVVRGGALWLAVPARAQSVIFALSSNCFIAAQHKDTAYGWSHRGISSELKESAPDLPALTRGSPAHWPDAHETTAELSPDKTAAYVVDTIKLPDPNPWGAPMFVGGFDFFPDGRAAVCTFHGDVFLVSGIDDKLEKVTWRRFASGLYHALGLKIVNGEIYVTCRDGIWRLKDLNGDGECDFYEAFNFDVKVTKSFHEFVFDLQTDPAGNFYFAKAGPVKNGGRGFDEIMAHHGSLLRVSPDGAKLEVVATGFRAPNGIGCGPRGELTSGDNEGTWTPVCKLNWIKPGGFYGVVPLAHRDPPPTDYDRPLCWLPKRVDNSGGGQVWVTSDKWGPWKDQLLHLSYGTCSVFGVLKEAVRNLSVSVPPGFDPAEIPATLPIVQGGVTRFPLTFQSGIMRARFNPVDGQLYVGGLRGWQTTGVKNGTLQRVRYTGAPVRMPIGLHATKRGVKLDFTCALDPATAGDPQNWNVEVWNYIWSSAYGSPEISTLGAGEKPVELGKDGSPQFSKDQAAQKKHDPLTVKSATLSADKKSVFLEIPEIKPVMQMAIKFGIQSADGAEVRSEIVNTIHVLAAE
jgi:hypothetical protein